jgi:hypothetical protein
MENVAIPLIREMLKRQVSVLTTKRSAALEELKELKRQFSRDGRTTMFVPAGQDYAEHLTPLVLQECETAIGRRHLKRRFDETMQSAVESRIIDDRQIRASLSVKSREVASIEKRIETLERVPSILEALELRGHNAIPLSDPEDVNCLIADIYEAGGHEMETGQVPAPNDWWPVPPERKVPGQSVVDAKGAVTGSLAQTINERGKPNRLDFAMDHDGAGEYRALYDNVTLYGDIKTKEGVTPEEIQALPRVAGSPFKFHPYGKIHEMAAAVKGDRR